MSQGDLHQLKSERSLANTGVVSELNSRDIEFPVNTNAFRLISDVIAMILLLRESNVCDLCKHNSENML